MEPILDVKNTPAHIKNHTENVEYQKWLSFLRFVNKNPKNRELISHYFFDHFASSPEKFYEFLHYFKKSLSKIKDLAVKKHLASQYLEVLSPLCKRFNFYEEGNTLENLCFKISDPETYEEINSLLLSYKKTSKAVVKKTIKILNNVLQNRNYFYELKGRYKNIYSISKKLERVHDKHILHLNDIFAFRIILAKNSEKECFDVLNLLHDTFYPLPDLFKDHITVPKINGYQSLHTGLTHVIPQLDLPIEIQIRTKDMHEFAENGLAAHWLYSQNKKSKLLSEKEKNLLKYFSGLSNTTVESKKFIYCFSMDGDVSRVEKDCSIIDFAYQIHTDLGNKAEGAIVNGKRKELSYMIQECDQIQILKSNKNQVSANWLSYVRSKNAIKKISEYLKLYAKKENLSY